MARASRLRRLEERLDKLRYTEAASAGAVSGIALGIAQWISNWLPGLQPHARGGLEDLLIGCVVGAAIIALIAVAGLALLRAWTRWRVASFRRRAI
ncbi:MAG: hypothetical protein LC776_03440 [Acidobacteria bacterium]|nr:hypothetical protein [Acidobacteriota bacterium]